MPQFRRVGADAEDVAADYLIALGYTVVTRRYKAKHGEIDVVALDQDLLVFVEVKSSRFDDARPEDALDERKARHLGMAAAQYLEAIGEPQREFRYDLVAVTPSGVRHYMNAFRGVASGKARGDRVPSGFSDEEG